MKFSDTNIVIVKNGKNRAAMVRVENRITNNIISLDILLIGVILILGLIIIG